MILIEGNLLFDFPDDWQCTKFDDWIFYTNQFQRIPHLKGVDFLTLDTNNCIWFIEVKDYRQHPRTKPIELADEITQKVINTLAALLPAKVNANEEQERLLASRILRAQRIRVILHLEQPLQHSRLFPKAIDLANVTHQLRQKLKAIDPHPKVVDTNDMRNILWNVRENAQNPA